MKVSIKQIGGIWDLGYALDKHVLSSEFIGYNEFGHPEFNTTRTEVGESLFRLKYRGDWSQIQPLANELATRIFPKFKDVGFLVPMPASITRAKQPVTVLTIELGKMLGKPVYDNLLVKKSTGKQLKNVNTKAEKLEILKDSFSINDAIGGAGPLNALLVDDLFATGASLEAACTAMRNYAKIRSVYVATLTWK